MNTIQMVDLKGQYLKIKEEIDTALLQAVEQSAYINGAQVGLFSDQLKAFFNAPHAVTCANGTDALQIALMALAFQPGDEVIVPAFNYVSVVEVIALLGLVPRFVDVRDDTFNIDVEQLEAVISPKTVAIVVTHLYGQCGDMKPVMGIARQHGLKVIEDAAQALGAEYMTEDGKRTFAGTVADIGTTSFFPSKNLGCFGDGGALFTHDGVLAKRIYMIAHHGQQQKYHHECIGINSRLDTIQAAVLNVKIKYLNAYTLARQEAAARYDAALGNLDGLTIPTRVPYSTHVFNQYTCRVSGGKRDALKAYLREKGIPSMIYYPVPMHLQDAYRMYQDADKAIPVAEKLCKEVISLPIHTEMTAEESDYITEHVKTFFRR